MADEPKKRVVALRYDAARDTAPKVVAKGQGRLAEQIIELARKNDVPVREDANLVQVLSRLNLDQEIPKEVYQAVATILAFLYKANRPTT
jgi:flagellar biosynthesis protein